MNQDSITTPSRITAVDQLRGYSIFGMFLVNASGYFNFKSEQIQHHKDWYSYADTIAPLFLFVVGMGMRLSWLNRSKKDGATETRWAMAKRVTEWRAASSSSWTQTSLPGTSTPSSIQRP